MELHHVGYAVRNLEAARRLQSLGCRKHGDAVPDERMGVEVLFLDAGGVLLELVAPLGPGSPVDSYLKYGPGPYHIGCLTDDLGGQINRMKAEGWKVVRPPMPARAFSDAEVVFLYHGSLGLIELIERLPQPRDTFYARVVKRGLDILFSAALLALLSPVFAVLAVLELVCHGKPALYKVVRAGKYGVPFVMYKFRSMTDERDAAGRLLPEEKRLTGFGRFLRRSSLDELPQLWNILRGDMSFIGPRPLEPGCVERYSARHRTRLSIRPGLACFRVRKKDETGTWTYREQFENDITYLRNVSFRYDLRMLAAIFRHVFTDTHMREYAMRPEFDGSNLDWKGGDP